MHALVYSEQFLGSSSHFYNSELHKANFLQMPSLNMRLWLPDMERDILAPRRRVDLLARVGEHIFGASHGYYRRPGNVNMSPCDVKEGVELELRPGFHSWLMSLLSPPKLPPP